MTNTEKRIENTTNKISKLIVKIDKLKVKVKNNTAGYYGQYDLDRANRELSDLNNKLEEYKAKRLKEIEDENNRVPVIEEFLENYRCSARKFYTDQYHSFVEFRDDFDRRRDEFEEDLKSKGFISYSVEWREALKEANLDSNSLYEISRLRYSSVTLDCWASGYGWEEKLEALLIRDVKAKRSILMNRIAKIVGKITDAKGLRVAGNGEINGYIIGDKGKAEVRTITAGGYNIQCLHFRVLVRDLK